MTPIHELISRIRWDPAYAEGNYVLGYWDRILGNVIQVHLADIRIDPADHFAFQLLDDEGVAQHVPWHRVTEVYRDGELIWHRSLPQHGA